MKEIRLLLENFWIDRDKNKEEYFEIKKERKKIEKFYIERTGWKTLFTEKVIKVEKIPAKAEIFMGINEFQDKMDYCILCGLLMFLEDREDGEQFLLKEMTDRIEFYLKDFLEIDWTKFTHRKSLIRVFEYAEGIRLIDKTEGNIKKYGEDEEIEVLYEKTGLSRYFSVNFEKDISKYVSYKDFEIEKNENIDINRGDFRTNRVYRKLLTTPAIYWSETNDQDRIYIKNQKPVIEKGLENFFNGKLHIHKNGAFLIFDNKDKIGEIHPKGTMLAELVLLVCNEVRKKVVNKEVKKELNDIVYISKKEMEELIEECKNRYGINWSKEYREMKTEKIFDNIMEYMKNWMLAEAEGEEIVVYPAVGKITGAYSKRLKSVKGEKDE